MKHADSSSDLPNRVLSPEAAVAPPASPCTSETAYSVQLDDPEATVRAGLALGRALLSEPHSRTPGAVPDTLHILLLYGDLGTGKTTFTRGLVAALPGGEQAEVASPSFTLCNSYPTAPPVLHCDLYRSEGALPDEVDEALDEAHGLVLVEWAERLPVRSVPRERLDICFQTCKNDRLLTLIPHGEAACRVLQAFQRVQMRTA